MKICFTVSAMESGGAEKVVSTLSNELTCLGHKVSIVMVSAIISKSYYELDKRVNLIALCEGLESATNPLKRVHTLKNALISENPDVTIAFLPHVCVYTWLALKGTNIPYILSERNDPNQYSFVYKVLIKMAFSAADGCVFQTHDAMSWYRRKARATDKIIFNIVGLTYIPETESNKKKKKSVLFVGRIDHQKNYKMLLNAFKRFNDDYSEYVLDFYGDGPEREEFFSLVSELHLNDKVIYHGKSSTWHKDEFRAGMYVSTSDYEGMSNSLEEAASLGIPCVATNCPIGGSSELANIFDNIVLSNVNDIDGFVMGMKKAIDMPCYFNGINPNVSKETIIKEWLNLIQVVRGSAK